MEKTLDILTIGECLTELSSEDYFKNSECFKLSFGGDVVVSAIAASRLGSKVGLMSSIGNDYFKEIILNGLSNYGIDTSHTKISDEQNGLYLCSHTDKKELIMYRKRVAGACLSPELFNEEYIASAQTVYATGISQSLSAQANELIKKVFEYAHQNDILTAYDPNYTSSFMTTFDTKEYLENIIENVDILFLSLKNDVEALYNLSSAERIINYFTDYGVKIIVIKSLSEEGYYIYSNGKTEFSEFYNKNQRIHTINAGDVFNGAFLSAITNGYTPIEAGKLASKMTGIYVNHSGLIKNLPSKEEIME